MNDARAVVAADVNARSLDGAARVIGIRVFGRFDAREDGDFIAFPTNQFDAALVGVERQTAARFERDGLVEFAGLRMNDARAADYDEQTA